MKTWAGNLLALCISFGHLDRAVAQQPVLVKDINLFDLGSQDGLYPAQMVASGGRVFFVHVSSLGEELWRSDGTAAGTVLVKDIDPGPAGAYFSNRLVDVDGTLFFVAQDGVHGRELWKSNGTAEGTVMVRDITPGKVWSEIQLLGAANGILFFSIENGLWRSDGTASGTFLLRDIGSFDSEAVALNDKLIFVTGDIETGRELWITDGTVSGTQLLKDIEPGPAPSSPEDFTVSGGLLFFRASDSIHGSELWKTDGTANGTSMVKDVGPGSEGGSPSELVDFHGVLLLSLDDGIHGAELWRSDGTEAGTQLMLDARPGALGAVPGELLVGGPSVFFAADDGIHGRNLWKSDGTPAGTVPVADLDPGSTESGPSLLAASDSKVFFVKYEAEGPVLWVSDGTEQGTNILRGFDFTASGISLGGRLFLQASSAGGSLGLWVSDGTVGGTAALVAGPEGSSSSAPEGLTGAGPSLYFSAGSPTGRELWKSDGTESGTVLVKDVSPGPASSFPLELNYANGLVFFTASSDEGPTLWRSDGTDAGTVPLLPAPSPAIFLARAGDLLFFRMTDPIHGSELWKSDGTSAGTMMVKDIAPGAEGSLPYQRGSYGSLLFFYANDGIHGRELWRSDGTEAGTLMVKDIRPGADGIENLELVQVGQAIYFAADDGVHGRELWKSDGTESGTAMVLDVEPGAAGSLVNNIIPFNSGVAFMAYGSEVWVSDGTPGGTVLVRPATPGDDLDAGTRFVVSNGVLFFVTRRASTSALWKSDGTSAGTTEVKSLEPEVGPFAPRQLTDVNGTLYFVASTFETGHELWKSDGTATGTSMVRDIFPSAGVAPLTDPEPQNLIDVSGTLFFTQNDGVHGRELWMIDTDAPVLQDLAVTTSGLSATLGALVVSDAGAAILERGFLYSAGTTTPDEGGPGVTKVTVDGTNGPMSTVVPGLTAQKVYSVRAFARTINGVGYDSTTFIIQGDGCLPGSYSPNGNSLPMACIPASPGFFVPVAGATAQTSCPSGSTSSSGAAACRAVTVSIADVVVVEGNSGVANAVFHVTLSEAFSQTASVTAQTSDGSAHAGTDYGATGPLQITFDPFVTDQVFIVPVTGDVIAETDETFLVTLSNPTNVSVFDGSALGSILSDDLASRTFVGTAGNDANDCAVQSTPCRSLAAALSQTAPDGELIVVSSGEYETGPLTIYKGIKISNASGTLAFLRQPIIVHAPGGRVVMRGLTLKGAGAGDAITVVLASSVSLEDLSVDAWSNGLNVTTSEAAQVSIVGSVFRFNTTGIAAALSATEVRFSVEGSRMEGNHAGLVTGGASAVVGNCFFVGNTTGMRVGLGSLEVHRSTFWSNATALAADTGASLRVSASHVFGNAVGFSASSGAFFGSSGSNVLRGNETNSIGIITPVPES